MLMGKYETRTWYTHYRGEVLFCASQSGNSDKSLRELVWKKDLYQLLTRRWNKLDYQQRQSGIALGVGRLVECRKMVPSDEFFTMVPYDSTLYVHIYADVRPIKPFSFKGGQGWIRIEENILDKIIYLKDEKIRV